ncbi:MAG: SDR family oxidoreductase [Myxococcota bacterium]|jgi:NAD(P)-dependent dehydrogenase (short-subunit alcohol dehydrogenase family)|nr:SDR family oxidoreductase [Myxococcota bacterium]
MRDDKPLEGKVALVTGASRGGGRGASIELGAAGATVYVTGRTTRAHAADGYDAFLSSAGLERMPGTIEDTAEAVTEAGGHGIPVRCDHTDAAEVRALFARIERDHERLDVLVNNAWGGHETFTPESLSAPFWEQPLDHWTSMFDHGVRNHVVACQAAAPMLVRRGAGLIVTTTFWDRDRYLRGNFFYDLAKAAMNRVAFAVAQELGPHGITSIALSPGWMRTELVLAGHSADERSWVDRPSLARTESTRYLGRAVVALATDEDVRRKNGTVQLVGELAREYGFTDVDGRVIPPFEIS